MWCTSALSMVETVIILKESCNCHLSHECKYLLVLSCRSIFWNLNFQDEVFIGSGLFYFNFLVYWRSLLKRKVFKEREGEKEAVPMSIVCPSCLIFLYREMLLHFYQSKVELQCCINFRSTAEWLGYIYIYIYTYTYTYTYKRQTEDCPGDASGKEPILPMQDI